MCECVKNAEEQTRQYFIQQHGKQYKDLQIRKSEMENILILFRLTTPFHYVEIEFDFEKTNGERSSTKKKKIVVFGQYCPFCGVKVEENKLNAFPTK